MKEAKIIKHGVESKSAYCRQCKWRGQTTAQAKRHNKATNHTVDVYYENWKEVTNNWRSKL